MREITLQGEPRSVTGSCPTLTFTLDGRTVYTTDDTDFKKGKCKDVSTTRKDIEVKGTLMSDNRVRANRITFGEDD